MGRALEEIAKTLDRIVDLVKARKTGLRSGTTTAADRNRRAAGFRRLARGLERRFALVQGAENRAHVVQTSGKLGNSSLRRSSVTPAMQAATSACASAGSPSSTWRALA